MAKKIKFDRANIQSTMEAAKKIAEVKTCFVFSTVYGLTISHNPPPFGQTHYRVTKDGVELIEKQYNF